MIDIAKIQPEGLTHLARRLRNRAEHTPLREANDMFAAADVLDGLAKLLKDIHSGDPTAVIGFFPEG